MNEMNQKEQKHGQHEESGISSMGKSALTGDQSEKGEQKNRTKKSGELLAKGDSHRGKSKENETVDSKKGVLPRLRQLDLDSKPLVPIDERFRKRWHVQGIIGKGGYGEIYLAIDLKRAESAAIKVEPKERKGKKALRMILEQKVLLKMQGKPHVPMFLASGHTENCNFIIAELLSINLGDIRRMSPTRKLSKSTVGRITVQGIAALRDLHEIGYLHRDVKPANMCFGITPNSRQVLKLLDFGLVRRFKRSNGEWRRPRAKAGFRGTQRYVSVRVHRRLEQTPVDDLTSLLYTAFELLAGELPWKSLEKSEDIWKTKEAMQHGHMEYFSGSATVFELLDFSKLVSGLDPLADPPYATLQTCIKKLYSPKKLSDLYDWENDFKEALLEKTLSTDETHSTI